MAYLAGYYQDKGATDDERLYFGVSSDGGTFRPIGRAVTNGIVRDPAVLPPSVAPDGRWHVACTNHTYDSPIPNNTVDIYTGLTLDGLNPVPRTVDCSAMKESGRVNWAWAPEWFKDSDGTVWLIVSVSTNADASLLQFLTWAVPATNSSLTAWGTPVKMDLPMNIDCYTVKVGGTYYSFVKSGAIQMYTASSFPGGSWTLVHSDLTPDAGNAEAPELVDMGGGTWRLYYDKWSDSGVIKYRDSADTFATFGATSTVSSVDRMRHVSVVDLAGEPPLIAVAAGGRRAQVAA